MSVTHRPLSSLHNLLLLWAVILVVCSTVCMVVTATSSAVDNQSEGHFKNSTLPNIPDRNEERAPSPLIDELVEGLEQPFGPDIARTVDDWLEKAGLKSRADDVFKSQEFQEAVDKILVAHSNNHVLAQEAMFKGLQRAIRAEDQADMFFELGRTIGKYKTANSYLVPSGSVYQRTESFEKLVEEANVRFKRKRFVLGLEPHLLNFWANSKITPETVWEGLELDVGKSLEIKNPSFRVYIDYVTHLEPDEIVRYDMALNGMRRSTTLLPDGSSTIVPDLVIAQQLVDADAPDKASVVTKHLMHALFRDWEKRGMTHDQLFHELLPSFTFELESLLQGPMKLWIAYFSKIEDQASYETLFQTIKRRAKSDAAVNDLIKHVDPLGTERQLVEMYTVSVIQPRSPGTAAEDLAYRSKLLFQEVFLDMERNGMTADAMLDFFKIRELQHRELLENPRLWTWMSFLVDSYDDIKNFESADPKKLRIIALVKRDGDTMFDHLKKQLDERELVTLVEKAIGWDQRYYYLFASNLADMWKSARKTSHDVFSLLGLHVPVKTLLMKDEFPLWFNFVIKTSKDEVKATLEMHQILKKMYAKERSNMPAKKIPYLDDVFENAMSKTVHTRPKLCECISKLWFVDLRNQGYEHYHFSKLWMKNSFDHYILTHRRVHYKKKLSVSLPEGFS